MMKNNNRNKWLTAFFCAWALFSFQIWIGGQAHAAVAAPIIIDHNCTNLAEIPQVWIQTAKSNLHIAYGHTSHGSQLTDGMTGLVGFINGGGLGLSLPHDIFQWNRGGTDGALDLREGDGYGSGDMDHDAGYYPGWVNETRDYLGTPNIVGRGQNHPDINVIIWSWCGQASGYTEQQMINQYLTPMTQLEHDYSGVTFVYMTGHSDGSGTGGILHARDQQIRNYCITNNKVLFDFYGIECYDPDGNYYGDRHVTDACNYDFNNDGHTDQTNTDPAEPINPDHNWATDWQNAHTLGVDWYSCGAAHTKPLNANRKAYAAWWLWAMLAGWDGLSGTTTYSISGAVTLSGTVTPLQGVTLSGLPGNPVSSTTGYYSAIVSEGWSGTVTPTLTGYSFEPVSLYYSGVTTDLTEQNYVAIVSPVISGTITYNGSGLQGVVLQGLPGSPSTNSSGQYTTTVPSGWDGTATPTLAGYTFAPTNRNYSDVIADQTGQDYEASRNSSITIEGGGGGGGGCFIASAAQTFNRAILALFPLLILFTLAGIYHRKTG